MAELTLDKIKGSPLGGMTVTATGAMALAALPVVTVDGRPATVTAWASGSVSFKTPARSTDGMMVIGDDDVDVLVNGTHHATYHYNCTRLDLLLHGVRAEIAQISAERGDYYTIGASQIDSFQSMQTDSGFDWPQGQVFAMPTEYSESGQDSPHGFYTGKTHCVAQFMLPLGEEDDWDTLLRWLQADLFRAIMLYREHDSIGNNLAVTNMFPGRAQNKEAGAFGVATVEFDVELKTRNTNQNSVTTGD